MINLMLGVMGLAFLFWALSLNVQYRTWHKRAMTPGMPIEEAKNFARRGVVIFIGLIFTLLFGTTMVVVAIARQIGG